MKNIYILFWRHLLVKESFLIGLVILAFSSFSFLGCTYPPEANISEITNTLNTYLKKKRLCVSSESLKMPVQTILAEEDERMDLDVLANAGYLSKSTNNEIVEYQLTNKGKKIYKSWVNFDGEDLGYFCYGYAQVVEVISFSSPENLGSYTFLITVDYNVKLAKNDKWVEAEVFKEFNSVRRIFDSSLIPIKKQAMLEYINNEWILPGVLLENLF